MRRRHFLMAASLMALGCGRASRKLRVFCYAGGHDATLRKVFLPAFEAATGIEAELHPGWWDGIAKLKAGGGDPPFDLMICDATQGYPAAREGLFAQLDLTNIPAIGAIAPTALDNFIARERLGVTYPDSVMTLAYDRERLPEAPANWADLLRPGLSGKLGLYSAFYMSLYTFACVWAALEGKPGTAQARVSRDIEGVLRFAASHRRHVGRWWKNSAEMILALANGDCAAGNMHSPEYLAALREKPRLAAVVPPTDRAYVQVFWAVPAGSKEQRLAERAIEVLFSPECQEGFARRGMAVALPKVAAKIAAEDKLWALLYPHTEEQFRALRYYPYEVYARDWDAISDQWDRTVLRKG